jgi:predicted Zn finger-like uncharacterized protein
MRRMRRDIRVRRNTRRYCALLLTPHHYPSGFSPPTSVFCTSNMYTRCPACKTVFHLRAAQLSAAQGQVRCGDCGEIFQSLSFLYDDADTAMARLTPMVGAVQREPDTQVPPRAIEEPVPIEEPPAPSLADVLAQPDQDLDVDEIVVSTNVASNTAEPVYPSLDQQDEVTVKEEPVEIPLQVNEEAPTDEYSPPRFNIPPDFILENRQVGDWSAARAASWIVAAVLVLGLIVQGVYASRGKLANDPDLLAWVARFCSVLDCELPFSRDVGDIQIIERRVREHPDRPGALLVYATFVNTSSFVQPYPVLELRLADLSGGRVAGRRFLPSEYLQDDANVKAGLPPDKPVSVELELVQPDINVVSYQFDFL